jgi:cyanophycin synthetase
MTDEVATVRALREASQHEKHLEAACELVARLPGEVGAHLEAAYGLDRAGFEHRAIYHYEIARRLGVPSNERRHFTVGYGSTLRNVGRSAEAVAVFKQSAADDPGYPAFTAFLAIALESLGRPRAALATMLACALDVGRPGVFDGYERALSEYQRSLLS